MTDADADQQVSLDFSHHLAQGWRPGPVRIESDSSTETTETTDAPAPDDMNQLLRDSRRTP